MIPGMWNQLTWGIRSGYYALPPRESSGEGTGEGGGPARDKESPKVLLLAEEADDVRQITAIVLREAGYEVVEAGSAEQAFLVARAEPRIDLLITAFVLPDKKASELVRSLLRQFPKLKVLYVLGGSEPLWMAKEIGENPHLLEKPYSPAELLHEVRAALGEEEAQDS